MENNNLRETASKIQKIIRGVIGTIGGTTAVVSLILGLYSVFGLSSPIFGLCLIVGMAPMDVLLTIVAMKSVTVEYLGDNDEDEEYDEDESYDCELTLVECNKDSLEQELDDYKEISSGIAPVVHLETFDSNGVDREYSRRRVMNQRRR